jgi:hypothetical protein
MPTKISRFGRDSSLDNPFSISSTPWGDRREKWRVANRVHKKTTVPKGRNDRLSTVFNNRHADVGRSCKASGCNRFQDRYRLLATLDVLLQSRNKTKILYGLTGIRTSDLAKSYERRTLTIELQARVANPTASGGGTKRLDLLGFEPQISQECTKWLGVRSDR